MTISTEEITGMIVHDSGKAYRIYIVQLNRQDVIKPWREWIAKSLISDERAIGPKLKNFRIHKWKYEELKAINRGITTKEDYLSKTKPKKELEVSPDNISKPKDYKDTTPKDHSPKIAVIGEDKYTCCPYCNTEWLTRTIEGKSTVDDHIKFTHPIDHKIIHSKSDFELIEILKHPEIKKNLALNLKNILINLITENGFITYIRYCLSHKLREKVGDAMKKIETVEKLSELYYLISDKFLKTTIKDKIEDQKGQLIEKKVIIESLKREVLDNDNENSRQEAAEKIMILVGYKKMSNMNDINSIIEVKIILAKNSSKPDTLVKIATGKGIYYILAEAAVYRLCELICKIELMKVAKGAHHDKIRQIASSWLDRRSA